jgi:streptomycin 6-kinase
MRFTRQLDIVVQFSKVEPQRLLRWAISHAALSSSMFLDNEEGDEYNSELVVA